MSLFFKPKRRCFTLIEILVSMGIFSIILVLMVQILTMSQNAWRNSKQVIDIFDSSRIVMEMLTRDLQAAVYSDNFASFNLDEDGDNTEMMAFAASSLIKANSYCIGSTSEVYYIYDEDEKVLKYGMIGDMTGATTPNDKFDFGTKDDCFDEDDLNDDQQHILARNVTGFKVTPIYVNSSGANANKLPDMVRIDLKLIDPDTAQKIEKLSAQEDRLIQTVERTFSRIIYVRGH